MKLNWKIWLLIFFILASLLAIFPLSFQSGVKIISVEQDSIAHEQGLRQGQIITEIDGNTISSIEDYQSYISRFPLDENQKVSITTKENTFILFTNKEPEIGISKIEKTRIKTGLDLSGGARALISAEEKELTNSELNDLISVTSERLNVYGLRDVQIRPVNDLSGNNFMLIEIAGSTPDELEDLISQQGKFEAKIGNDTVFEGGKKDITYVARTGEQSGIYSCSQTDNTCNFRFAISLSEEAAKRHADITCDLASNLTLPQYLEKPLDLYLDEVLVDSLLIGRDLRCSETTQIQISGSGSGLTRDEAYSDAENQMKQLQTVLISGSLPYKLKIEKLDTISPLLGKEFISMIIIAGISAIIAVGLLVFIRYRRIKLSLAVLLTSLSEVLIILGFSALFNRNLDLPAIAGIIAAIGTGVDSQIIILDESQASQLSLKERIKRALYIILGTYITTLFALLPLMWAGAGLLKGFAITTIIGISVGVFITRPAFSEMVKRILRD
ncbi:preprotein translocase subunit SecD [Candidatus Pacearchaeota archaeon]|nr:preprotein translocase subunit SecD [Candidatus Pacearchaeota archaeon]|tara:strand:+ start:1329 stop:2828 length:1500 start_codon:yes stop_codon:yes gene_type:complete